MKSMKKLVLGLLMCGLMSAPALATITITPDDGVNHTYQEWSFTAPPPPPAPSLGATDILADPGWLNSAPPTADVALTIGAGEPLPGWYNVVDNSGRQGIIFGHSATIDLLIPNIIDPRFEKIIQVEVIYHIRAYEEGVHGYIDGESSVTAGNDPPYRSISVNDTALADGWRDVTIEWRIPQIYPVEMVHLYFVDTGVAIDRIEVATVCVPEPATLLLLGGAGLVGWLRRRRAL
jgi:hypothetical protein